MMTPTARSTTLPRAANSRNSDSRLIASVFQMISGVAGGVQPLAQLLAALEKGHGLGRDLDRFAGAGVAPRPRRSAAHRKGAEAAKLDPSAFGQGVSHAAEDHIYDPLHLGMGEVQVLSRQLLDQFRLDHSGPRHGFTVREDTLTACRHRKKGQNASS